MISSCIPISFSIGGGGETTIPILNPDYLPKGIHDCTLDEIAEVFGQGDRRRDLAGKLREFILELRRVGVSGWILVDGSFVSSKDWPGDIDVIVVIDRKKWTICKDPSLRVSALRLLGMGEARRRFELHVIPGYADGSTADGFINPTEYMTKFLTLFTTVKYKTNRKGILRVAM